MLRAPRPFGRLRVVPSNVEGRAPVEGRTSFLVGANLPWVVYGCDFGANRWQPGGGLARPERRERARRALLETAAAGAEAVRWFLFCDGRAGLRVDPDEGPVALDEHVIEDLEVALALLGEAGLRAIFVLFDFTWFSRRRMVNGVQLGGRWRLLADRRARAGFLDAIVTPILDRFGRHPAILAWEVMNEPEWAMRRVPFERRRLPFDEMRALVSEVCALVHARTGHLVTLGSMRPSSLGRFADLPLDFHQVHWYDKCRVRFDLEHAIARHGAGRPVLLGEFPTGRSRLSPTEIITTARARGYAGAFGWSIMAGDRESDFEALKGATRGASMAGW